MKFCRAEITDFGKLKNWRAEFAPGINLIYGANESGKTTLHTFLRSMLFGLERKRGRAAANDDWSRHEPWDYRGRYGGSLVFQSGDRMFQVERSFDRYRKYERLFCLDDGEELSFSHGDLEMLLCQMSESGYQNSISLEQNRSLSREELAAKLRNQAANYSGSASDSIDVAKATGYLKEKRKEAERKLREIEVENDRKRSALEQKREYLQAEKDRKKAAFEQLSGEIEAEEGEEEYKVGRDPLFLGVVAVVTIVAIILGAFDFVPFPWNLLLIVFAVIMEEIWYAISRRGAEGDRNAAEAENLENEDRDWRKKVLRQDIRELNTQLQNIKEELQECVVGGSDYATWKRKQQVFKEAEERIRMLSSDLMQTSGNSGNLAERMSEIIADITERKYEKVYLDENMNCSVYTDGAKVPAEELSRGTLEQLLFAMRMAAAEELYDEPMPVVLDDAFVYYDDERLAGVLRWLARSREQVLLFTCHSREEELLREMGIRYWKIQM